MSDNEENTEIPIIRFGITPDYVPPVKEEKLSKNQKKALKRKEKKAAAALEAQDSLQQ